MKPASLHGISYAAASASDRKRFAPALKASGGLVVSSSVHHLLVSDKAVGSVAVFRTKPGRAKSPIFQDQYVVQLINAIVGKTTRPKFVRADGQVMALSTRGVAVAGWFEGDRVVLVYRQARTPDLAALATAVRSTPTGR